MGTFNLSRFSKPELLRKIDKKHLIAFLKPYSHYLSIRGVQLKSFKNGLDYDSLSSVLLNPDSRTPTDMIEALYYVNEMSTQIGFDLIQNAIAGSDLDMEISDNTAYADLVMQVWMKKRNLIERLHAQQFMHNPRSFEYFKCTKQPIPEFEEPSDETIFALESSLNIGFSNKRRGDTCKVFVYVKPDSVWFLIRHGNPYTREAIIENGESSSLFYRPEKNDVLVYNKRNGELRMNAQSKWEKELYRTKFGYYFFGDRDVFERRNKFTLEPLRENGVKSILCDDIDGMVWVRLKEVHIYCGNLTKDMKIFKSEDVFAMFEQWGESFPSGGAIAKASFLIKFTTSKTPRTVTISYENRAQFKRDGDSTVIEEWLTRRGFIIESEDEGE